MHVKQHTAHNDSEGLIIAHSKQLLRKGSPPEQRKQESKGRIDFFSHGTVAACELLPHFRWRGEALWAVREQKIISRNTLESEELLD